MPPQPQSCEYFWTVVGHSFREVMLLTMHNLAVAQQRYKERYKLVRGYGRDHPKASSKPGDYVLLKRKTKHTLDVPTRPHILQVVELKDSGVAVPEALRYIYI